jgi:3-dehydroquinate synthase class II
MTSKASQTPIANKIKKWVQTAKEVEKTRLAISITRLTSIKSLCTEDRVAAEKFALYIAKYNTR